MPQFQKLYLLSYNSLQALGWAVALYRILGNYISSNSLNGAYHSAGELICKNPNHPKILVYGSLIFGTLQIVAFLEVLHGAIGIVPSGVLLPLMQWSGRTHFLLAIVRRINEVHELPSVFITFVAWSLSDIIRYLHYASNCIGPPPHWITYLRYTGFIILYPIGVGPGEMWLMYQALPIINKKELYAGLPFNYYNFILVLLLCYPLLWLKLYLHLFKQRRSKLGKPKKKIN